MIKKKFKKSVSAFMACLMAVSMMVIPAVPTFAANSVNANAIIKSWGNATFEKRIKDTTGWTTETVTVYKAKKNGSRSTTKNGTMKAKDRFLILGAGDGYFKINNNGKIGYIKNGSCLINLPDVVPSIQYRMTNITGAIYKCKGKKIDGVTDKKLYNTDKVYNSKIKRDEYIVPIMYKTAKQIAEAQKRALKKGYCLKIYDAFRPHDVTDKIYSKFNNFLNNNSSVKKKAFNGTYGKTWFLAKSISTHNVGTAIDVTMVSCSSGKECSMPSPMHELSVESVKYSSSSTKNKKSGYAKGMTSAAKTMNEIFIDSGMDTLASEWWHFQDSGTFNDNKSAGNTLKDWYPQKLGK